MLPTGRLLSGVRSRVPVSRSIHGPFRACLDVLPKIVGQRIEFRVIAENLDDSCRRDTEPQIGAALQRVGERVRQAVVQRQN
jgi:hypothetical protein